MPSRETLMSVDSRLQAPVDRTSGQTELTIGVQQLNKTFLKPIHGEKSKYQHFSDKFSCIFQLSERVCTFMFWALYYIRIFIDNIIIHFRILLFYHGTQRCVRVPETVPVPITSDNRDSTVFCYCPGALDI